jgi:hypothetical protein
MRKILTHEDILEKPGSRKGWIELYFLNSYDYEYPIHEVRERKGKWVSKRWKDDKYDSLEDAKKTASDWANYDLKSELWFTPTYDESLTFKENMQREDVAYRVREVEGTVDEYWVIYKGKTITRHREHNIIQNFFKRN